MTETSQERADRIERIELFIYDLERKVDDWWTMYGKLRAARNEVSDDEVLEAIDVVCKAVGHRQEVAQGNLEGMMHTLRREKKENK